MTPRAATGLLGGEGGEGGEGGKHAVGVGAALAGGGNGAGKAYDKLTRSPFSAGSAAAAAAAAAAAESLGAPLRGVVLVSGGGTSTGGFCSALAEALGAAHISLPEIMRSQMRDTPQDATPLARSLRAGKMVPAAVALEALRTAVHAAPEVLVLVEHAEL